jgi:hypothetical protein
VAGEGCVGSDTVLRHAGRILLPRSRKTTLDGNVNDLVRVRISYADDAVCTCARVMYVCGYRLLPNVSR